MCHYCEAVEKSVTKLKVMLILYSREKYTFFYTIMILSRNSSSPEVKEKKWRRERKSRLRRGEKKLSTKSKRNYASNFHMLHLTHFTRPFGRARWLGSLNKKKTEKFHLVYFFRTFTRRMREREREESTDTQS